MIPRIDISPLFGPASPGRAAADRAVMEAASGIGFMTVTGFPGAEFLTPGRRGDLLGIFALPEAEKRKLWRWNFDNSRPNVYRGWYPVQEEAVSHKEGIDIGPDLARGAAALDAADPLREPTPLPPEALVPGWRAAASAYYRAMEETGAGLMRAVARGLGLAETVFDAAFENGISTLRLTRYPERKEGVTPEQAGLTVEHKGRRRPLIGAAHVDSGFVTLLAQDGVEGLQAQTRDGEWIDVPPADGTLAVNFGRLLERWTGGRVRATLHRVVAPGRERFSIPFFYEPAAEAEIAPLPIAGTEPFEPFLYGDYLWEAATNFVEQRGIRHLRRPRRAPAS
jgi:isopenicillin N synthase-like dioxygenase